MVTSISMFTSNQTQTTVNLPPNLKNLFNLPKLQREKVVVVMGATGTGKSRLSIDIATRFPAEIINSDKIQIHRGLDVVTNKLTGDEQRNIPHHLLGVISPFSEFSSSDFCTAATRSLESIAARRRLPIIAGGSNSFIEALIDAEFRSNYDCCFLWVDVEAPELHSFVAERVDKMVAKGMVEEARQFFHPNADYSRGIRRAIGVPEFDSYFRYESIVDRETQAKLLREAIGKIKMNTCRLASSQLGKILRLRSIKGWKIHRLDATQVFRKKGKEAEEAWDELVAGPSSEIVEQFLQRNNSLRVPADFATLLGVPIKRRAAMAAAAR